MLLQFRFVYEVLGAHTHVKVFAGTGVTLANCGDLTFGNEEWASFMDVAGPGGECHENWQFVDVTKKAAPE